MRSRCLSLLLGVLFVFGSGCAVNPVTGRPELMVVSSEQEQAMGREAAAQVEREMGLVDDPGLTSYVKTLGDRLAAHSPRKDVPYHFAVADMAEANAFALPGGHVYVSRGLLAIANSEAELANVIGHEIGHVAARHSAQRQTQSLGVGLASVLGAAAAGVVGGAGAANAVGALGQAAGAGLIASYGRDQERQSDEVGQTLAAAAGFEPGGMASFLDTLQRDSELSTGPGRRPSFLDSHPMTAERVATTAKRAPTLAVADAAPIAGTRSAFYQRIAGMAVGEDPSKGVFDEDNRFRHPELDFAIDLPPGWKTANQPQAVLAQSPDQQAMFTLELQEAPRPPKRAAIEFARAQEFTLQGGESLRVHGLDAYQGGTIAQGRSGPLPVEFLWVSHPRGTFRLTAIASGEGQERHAASLAAAGRSFRRLSSRERGKIERLQLRVVRARGGETLAAVGERSGNRWSLEKTAVANGLSAEDRLEAGRPVKVAVGVPYR